MSYNEKEYDVIVAGGGLSGVAAAVAAARNGCNVLLIEKNAFLGGMATAGLVNPFMPYCIWKVNWQYNWDEPVNKGVFGSILTQLNVMGGLHQNKQTFNEELLKIALDRMLKDNYVEVLLHSFVVGVECNNNVLKSVSVANKGGVTQYCAKYYVDASGDGDVAAYAGCEFKVGREQDNLCQPMTLCFRLANVDLSKYDKQVTNIKYHEAKENGLISNPREDVLTFAHMVDDVLHFNSTRIIKKSAVNPQELTQAEIEAREQVYELFQFMKMNVPGFENCQLLMSASQIGIRESRRIVGSYTISQNDITQAVKFDDSIARGNYPMDIHNPSGTGTEFKNVPIGDYYTIPYRALVPLDIYNLIVAGRPISSTHESHSAYRIMPICTSIGEGAGTAAAVACKTGVSFNKVDVKAVQALLKKHDALY